MDCSEALELLSRSMDGEASPEEGTRLEDHVRDCLPCQERRAAFGRLRHLLEPAREDAAPSELWSRIEARARHGVAPPGTGRLILLRAAACFFGAAATLLLGVALSARSPGLEPHVEQFVAERLSIVHGPLAPVSHDPLYPEVEEIFHGHSAEEGR